MFLKVPVKPEELPDVPDPTNKKLMRDENEWVYEAYMKLRTRIFESVDPLNLYLATYDQFLSDYNLDPDKEIAIMGDESDPKDPDTLRADVIKHRQRAAKIMDLIPEYVVVSFFQIDCRLIRTNLAEKHLKIAREEIEIIARKAKIDANAIMREIDEMDIKIMAVPTNIEELSEIR
jgi:dynein heavy chain